jgi:endonuclease/exonuclease/phosphatase family metal-dependent hydrolase
MSLVADATSGANIDLKVMSFNIRYSYGKPQEPAAENDWDDVKSPRRERAIRVICDYQPDVLGVQEARDLQIDDLKDALPEYEFYGIGRDDGKTEGEFSGIYFRADRFTKKDAGSFWLSETPEKPGTTFYNAENAVPRIASWVRLVEKTSNREIFVLNMHWDHIDAPARRQSAALVRKRLAELAEGLPTIVMGDLNSGERSPEYRELVGEESGRKLLDSYRTIHSERKPDESTFGGWEGHTEGRRIDFILHTDEFTPTAAAIVRTNYDGRWPSDHYPVTATLRLK